jgi:hypothetical protein
MSDEYVPLAAEDLAVRPVRELLVLAGELFAALLGVDTDFTDADLARGQVLRLALAEVTDRAQRIFPVPFFSPLAGFAQATECACSCGESFMSADGLDEHFWAVFVPADDIGLDGKPHAEVAQDLNSQVLRGLAARLPPRGPGKSWARRFTIHGGAMTGPNEQLLRQPLLAS